MNKNNIENKFSADIDSYINGIENIDSYKSKEYEELFKVGKMLANKDFSKFVDKKSIYKKCIKNINKEKGDNFMKKLNIISKVAAASVALVVGSTAFMQTSFAKSMPEEITKVISLGRITAVQTKKTEMDKNLIPANLKGKLFDKNRNMIKIFNDKNRKELYTVDGDRVVSFSSDGKIVTQAEVDNSKTIITDINDISNHCCFKVTLPSYLPDGYKFIQAVTYKDEKGNSSGKYLLMYFTNDKTGGRISIDERLNCEETQYYEGGDDIEKTKINNLDAVLIDNKIINWQTDSCLYSVVSHGISVDQMKQVAESIK